ncbi:Uncharacterised protein [uncultured archaeon]|nr:Uncharacterised protein [uncultured archaeon]
MAELRKLHNSMRIRSMIGHVAESYYHRFQSSEAYNVQSKKGEAVAVFADGDEATIKACSTL